MKTNPNDPAIDLTKLQIISSRTSKSFHPVYGHLYFTNDIEYMMNVYAKQENSADKDRIRILEDQNKHYKEAMEEIIKRGSPIDFQKEWSKMRLMIREALNKEI